MSKNETHDYDLEKLHDSGWQHGLSWRKKMLIMIAKLRKEGYSELYIKRELKRSGLVNHTLNALMDDAKYFDDEEESVFEKMLKKKPEKPKKKKPKEESIQNKMLKLSKEKQKGICKNCGKKISKNRYYCNEECLREHYKKKGEKIVGMGEGNEKSK